MTPKDTVAGFVYADSIGRILVMAVVGNWAMCRRPGAVPFTIEIKQIVHGLLNGTYRAAEK